MTMNQLGKTALALAAAGLGAWLLARTRRPEYTFAGKVVLITGGSRGLGLVLARELAGEGALLAICARDAAELQRAAADLRGYGRPLLTMPCDVTDPADVRHLV